MKANHEQGSPTQVMDARPNGRYRGIAPEPRPDIPSGHIPLSLNLPFFECFDRENNVLLPKEKLLEYIQRSGVDVGKDMVVSCGSGMSACILGFATFLTTGNVVPVFDGSWFEWQTNTPSELQIREEKKD